MQTNLFITGTDTEIGKTFVACALLEALKGQGVKAVGYKPVAAGVALINGRYINEDADRLQHAGSPGFSIEEINPVCLTSPIAPHLAAEEQGTMINRATLLRGYEHIAARAERVIVEGVGGFRVPLGDSYDTAMLAQDLGLPVVLVVGLRLGCINHALLTAEAVVARGLSLYGWIGNTVSPRMSAMEGNLRALTQRIAAPCLGVIPHMEQPDPRLATSFLRFPG